MIHPTQTGTVTIPPEPVGFLHLNPPESPPEIPPEQNPPRVFDLESYIDRLDDILFEFNNASDFVLSNRLLYMGNRIYVMLTEINFEWNDITKATLIRRAKKLVNKKLRDLLDGSPKGKFVLERQWPWKKWKFRDYQVAYQSAFPGNPILSPFDMQEVQPVLPHEFANKMKRWAKALLVELENPPAVGREIVPALFANLRYINRSLTLERYEQGDALQRVGTYLNLAKIAISKERLRDLGQRMDVARHQMALAREEDMRMVAEAEERMRRGVAEHNREIENRLEGERERTERVFGEMEARIEATNTRSEEVLQETQEMIEEAQDEIREEAEEYREEMAENIRELQESHQRETDNLRSEVQATQERNEALSQQVRRGNAQIAQLKVEATNRLAQARQQERAIRKLNKKAKKKWYKKII